MVGPEDRTSRGQLRAAGAAERVAETLKETAPDVAGGLAKISPRELGKLARGPALQTGQLGLPEHTALVSSYTGSFPIRYDAEHPVTVPADGSVHTVALLRNRSEVSRVYRCWPRLDPNVYEVALFKNPLGVPLLRGPVRVYRGTEFIVDVPLETSPPGKSIELGLGVEQAISVARNVHFDETTGGLAGGATILKHKIEIEVRSKLLRPVHLEVFERVPITSDKGIEIEVTRSEPTAEPYDQMERRHKIRGGYRFVLELAPQETKSCTLEYEITIPTKSVLEGGNRRE